MITKYEWEETNTARDPAKERDGGGYHWPRHTITFDDGWKVVLHDTSCGSFGSRWCLTVKEPGGKFHTAFFGSMHEEPFTDLSDDDVSHVRALEKVLREEDWRQLQNHIPFVPECETGYDGPYGLTYPFMTYNYHTTMDW